MGCVCVVVAGVVHCAPLHDCGLLCLLLNTVLLAAVAAALSLGAGLVCNLRAAQLAQVRLGAGGTRRHPLTVYYLQVSGTGAPAWLPGSWLAVVLLGLGSLWVLLVAALLGISYGVSTNTKQGGAFTQLHSV